MATGVTTEPGIYHFTCDVTAELVDDEVELDVSTGYPSVTGMFEALGATFATLSANCNPACYSSR